MMARKTAFPVGSYFLVVKVLSYKPLLDFLQPMCMIERMPGSSNSMSAHPTGVPPNTTIQNASELLKWQVFAFALLRSY